MTFGQRKPKPRPNIQQVADAALIVSAINRIDECMRKIDSSGLNRRALIALLKEFDSSLSKDSINRVLSGLSGLRRAFLKKEPKQ